MSRERCQIARPTRLISVAEYKQFDSAPIAPGCQEQAYQSCLASNTPAQTAAIHAITLTSTFSSALK
jgi:hypothetical protein